MKDVGGLEHCINVCSDGPCVRVHLLYIKTVAGLHNNSLEEKTNVAASYVCSFSGTGFLLMSVPAAATCWPFEFNFLKTAPIS